MTFTAADVLVALLNSGHSVRRDGDRIMIAPTADLSDEDKAAITANRDGILALLRGLEGYATLHAGPHPQDPFADDSIPSRTPTEYAEHCAALRYWTEYNAATTATAKPTKRRPQTETEELFQ